MEKEGKKKGMTQVFMPHLPAAHTPHLTSSQSHS